MFLHVFSFFIYGCVFTPKCLPTVLCVCILPYSVQLLCQLFVSVFVLVICWFVNSPTLKNKTCSPPPSLSAEQKTPQIFRSLNCPLQTARSRVKNTPNFSVDQLPAPDCSLRCVTYDWAHPRAGNPNRPKKKRKTRAKALVFRFFFWQECELRLRSSIQTYYNLRSFTKA